MNEDIKVQNLADTLSRSGLAASAGEAMRMAKSILGIEHKIVNQNYEKEEKTYEDEINELINKTSPEKKDFHIPIKNYKIDQPTIVQNVRVIEKKEEQNIVEELQDSPQISKVIEIETETEPKASNDDETTLRELMDEDAAEVYSSLNSHEKGKKQDDFILDSADSGYPNNLFDF